jgi:hypothetical protein
LHRKVVAMWSRTYRPGLSPEVMFCPRFGRVVTRLRSDHGSPWDYDVHIPLMIHAPGRVQGGRYPTIVRPVDVVPTISRLLCRPHDPTLPGRVLTEALIPGTRPPRVLMTIVLDQVGYRALEKALPRLPVLSKLAGRSAWFTNDRLDYLPSITTVSHAVLSTGRYPGENGITTDRVWDEKKKALRMIVSGGDPSALKVPTLMELWHRENRYRPKILSISYAEPAACETAGHRDHEVFGHKKMVAYWDLRHEGWSTNHAQYRLPAVMKKLDLVDVLGPLPSSWRGYPLTTPRQRAHWPMTGRYVGEVVSRAVEEEGIGRGEGPTDLIHVTFKEMDAAGHWFGNGGPEFFDALGEVDKALGRIVSTLEKVAGPDNVALVITADHGGLPEELRAIHKVIPEEEFRQWLLERLPTGGGVSCWLRRVGACQLHLDRSALEASGYRIEDVARVLRQHPAIQFVFTGADLAPGVVSGR